MGVRFPRDRARCAGCGRYTDTPLWYGPTPLLWVVWCPPCARARHTGCPCRLPRARAGQGTLFQ